MPAVNPTSSLQMMICKLTVKTRYHAALTLSALIALHDSVRKHNTSVAYHVLHTKSLFLQVLVQTLFPPASLHLSLAIQFLFHKFTWASEDQKRLNPPFLLSVSLPLAYPQAQHNTSGMSKHFFRGHDSKETEFHLLLFMCLFWLSSFLCHSLLQSLLSCIPWLYPVRAMTSVLFIFHVFSLHFWLHHNNNVFSLSAQPHISTNMSDSNFLLQVD